MKLKKKPLVIVLISSAFMASFYLYSKEDSKSSVSDLKPCCSKHTNLKTENPDSVREGCVFKTVFESEYLDSDFVYATPENVKSSMQKALTWIVKEQLPDGGWYGGFNATQNVLYDQNAKADPATTAMVSMALLRCGSTPVKGDYSQQLKRSTEYLLLAVEGSDNNASNITSITGTQPQVKLGQNIDVMLTSQYLTNLLSIYQEDAPERLRLNKCIEKCVSKIQKSQTSNGSFQGGGWAGVLQSSVANNALESAESAGIKVDTALLEKSKDYQKGNFDFGDKSVDTDDGAGIVLYSLSGSSRASAKEANVAKNIIKKAKKEGKVTSDTSISVDNLVKAGLSKTEALKYNTAYMVNTTASQMAQSSQVMSGFGSNGGEEFYSFLQTGEGLVISHDKSWKVWYANVTGKLVQIQEENGNWQGHHCITSPVFCTATCLLILSVNNDMQRLLAIGK